MNYDNEILINTFYKLENEKPFINLNFNSLMLARTHFQDPINEGVEITSTELFAIKYIFDFIFEDFEESTSNKTIWETIYTFPETKESDDSVITKRILDSNSQYQSINHTASQAYNFLLELCRRSLDMRDNKFNKIAISKKSRFFLIGDIGIGKTTFFKYLYSKYYESVINKLYTFWVHIDFSTDPIGDMSISEAIKLVAAQIFRVDYYNNYSPEEKKELKNYLRTYYSPENKNFEYDYTKFESHFDNQIYNSFSNEIQLGLINYIEEKYGVIYIIDGLDSLNSYFDIHTIFSEVNNILTSHNRIGVFVFVMRPESHESYLASYLDIQNEDDKAKPIGNVFRIEEAELTNIISNRFKLLLLQWPTVLNNNKNTLFEKDEFTSDPELIDKMNILYNKFKNIISKESIEAYFNIFLIYLHHGISLDDGLEIHKWNKNNTISALKHIVGTNVRKSIDAIIKVHDCFLSEIEKILSFQDVIEIYFQIIKPESDFLSNKSNNADKFIYIINRSYKVIPILFKAKGNYKHPYYYQYSIDGQKLKIMGDYYDHSDLLFNVYYSINSTQNINEQYTILLKIRILQILNIYKEQNESIRTRDELTQLILRYFNYKDYYITLAIEELFHTRLIAFDVSESGYKIVSTLTGQNHVTNLIRNFSYLRVILSDILVPKQFVNCFKDPNPDMFKHDRQNWIINQIPRISLFVLLIKSAEEWETSNRKETSLSFPSISKHIIDSLIISIKKICLKEPRERNVNLLNNSFKRLLNILKDLQNE